MRNTDNYLFAVSFTVFDQSGVALVSAPNASTAFQILKNQGRYNCNHGQDYILVQTRNLGLYTCLCPEVLMESFVSALIAYDKFISKADSFVGPEGPQGPVGPQGPPGVTEFATTEDILALFGGGGGTPSYISGNTIILGDDYVQGNTIVLVTSTVSNNSIIL